jgi:hypothetical protein
MAEDNHTSEVHSFDELARGLSTGAISRRKALRLIGVALAGSALAAIPGVAEAGVKGPPPGKGNCPPGFIKCRGGTCVNPNTNPSNCGGCNIQCSPGETCCSGQCADLQTDENNCRACGQPCPPGATCFGDFGCTCPDGRTACGFTGTEVCCPEGTFCANNTPATCCPIGTTGCGASCCASGECCQDTPTGAACVPC